MANIDYWHRYGVNHLVFALKRVIFIGDIDGQLGRAAVKQLLPSLISQYQPDFIIANAENATHGIGITPRHANELLAMGIDALTLGDHAFDKPEIVTLLSQSKQIIRPLNYPTQVPGFGYQVVENSKGDKLLVVNLLGQVFMKYDLDNPYLAIEKPLKEYPNLPTLVDLHAEATSEKRAMGFYLDGRVTAVVGTHTHVPTADEQVLPNGTAYISDAGMVGPANSILGMDKKNIIDKFVDQRPYLMEPAPGPMVEFGAVVIEYDPDTTKAISIERINQVIEVVCNEAD